MSALDIVDGEYWLFIEYLPKGVDEEVGRRYNDRDDFLSAKKNNVNFLNCSGSDRGCHTRAGPPLTRRPHQNAGQG